MALTMGILWKAKLNLRQKLGLGTVFCLGLIIIAMSIVRAVEVTGKTYSDRLLWLFGALLNPPS